jgi:hypothetical protein
MDNFEEDNIRRPDKVINEQLIEDVDVIDEFEFKDTRDEFEKQLDEAMYLSIQEMNQQKNINQNYEEKIRKEYDDETIKRREIFSEFLFNMNKIKNLDKEINEIYNIIDPIIEAYCGQLIQSCEFDEKTYNKIFNTIKKIRNNKIAFDTLKTIIFK